MFVTIDLMKDNIDQEKVHKKEEKEKLVSEKKDKVLQKQVTNIHGEIISL